MHRPRAMTPGLWFFLLAAASSNGADPIVIGVLEEPQCKRPPFTAVRALFALSDGRWTPLSERGAWAGVSLGDVGWSVTFDGGSRGGVRTVDLGFQTEYEWTFSRDRLLLLAPGSSAPVVDNKDGRYGGWCGPPSRRPLVVVSKPNFRDPGRWTRFMPGDAIRRRIFPEFRAQIGIAETCAHENGPEPFSYAARDLLFSASYRDRKGRLLVTVGLDSGRNQCDGPPASAWLLHTFVITANAIRYLGVDLTLVDAGDYDADGASELLFWQTRYNEDGYVLFDSGLDVRADYWWSYH